MTRAPLLLAVLISILCGAYTHTAPAATVRMASETFVTNKITQAIAALPPAQTDLTPATNYTDSATNALTDALTRWDNPMIVNQARWAENAISADGASYAERSGQANFAAGAAYADWSSGLAGETQPIRRGDAIFAQLDAATETNAAQSAQIAAIETNIVRATNPNFSNAVLQVGIGVDPNTVAAINALVESGDELPVGGATTVGALLLALAAAVAALRKSKADVSALRYDLGDVELASGLINTDSSDPSNPIDYAALTLNDREVGWLVVDEEFDELRLTFPTGETGKVRDFGLLVEVDADKTAPALTLVQPSGTTIVLVNPDGAMPTLADGDTAGDESGKTILYFSEVSTNRFLVKGEQVKEVL
jgi:hypothetical protein